MTASVAGLPIPYDGWLGLGSNLAGAWGGSADRQVAVAMDRLCRLPGISVLAASPVYRSPPMGPADQPDYANAVVRIRSRLSPMTLLAQVKRLERLAGRDPASRRWGERALDIDLLALDRLVLRLPGLELPHPGLLTRSFVLRPWADIGPDWVLPGGRTVAECAARMPTTAIEPWEGV